MGPGYLPLPPCYWHLVVITGDLFTWGPTHLPTFYWYWHLEVATETRMVGRRWYASYWNAVLDYLDLPDKPTFADYLAAKIVIWQIFELWKLVFRRLFESKNISSRFCQIWQIFQHLRKLNWIVIFTAMNAPQRTSILFFSATRATARRRWHYRYNRSAFSKRNEQWFHESPLWRWYSRGVYIFQH